MAVTAGILHSWHKSRILSCILPARFCRSAWCAVHPRTTTGCVDQIGRGARPGHSGAENHASSSVRAASAAESAADRANEMCRSRVLRGLMSGDGSMPASTPIQHHFRGCRPRVRSMTGGWARVAPARGKSLPVVCFSTARSPSFLPETLAWRIGHTITGPEADKRATRLCSPGSSSLMSTQRAARRGEYA
jgi:hypothetical protein